LRRSIEAGIEFTERIDTVATERDEAA
jgi:hypothetical protein